MLEHVFRFQRTDDPVFEEVAGYSGTHGLLITHGVLPLGEATPHDNTDSEVTLIVVRGTLALRVADQLIHTYEAGTIVAVPSGITMELRSAGLEPLEFFMIKEPLSATWTLPKAV
jgi:quercetin dioxygenase-like cupin family protein